MPLALLLVPWVALQIATVSPPSVPAQGKTEVTLNLDSPGYYRIRAESPAGTACQLVDQLRGPFLQNGRSGKRSCDTSELLDAGSYLLRLTSPRRGKGRVQPSATAFRERNQRPLQLKMGQALETPLPPFDQASYALRFDKPGVFVLRVAGRTAGDVKLWRGGEFVETVIQTQEVVRPRAGQPIREWWLTGRLEAGDYRLTVYGLNALPWTEGVADDQVSLSYGFPSAELQGGETGTLPRSGFWGVFVPKGDLAAVLSAQAGVEGRFELGTFYRDTEGVVQSGQGERNTCQIERKALWRDCAALNSGDGAHLVWVRGPPGASFSVQWAPLANGEHFSDGAYGPPREVIAFDGPDTGDFLVATHDVPGDADAVPLSCTLIEETGEEQRFVARDALALKAGESLERPFNYDGNHGVFEFQLAQAGRYHLTTSGQRKSQCELYALDGLAGRQLSQSTPKSGRCDLTLSLGAGFHQLTLNSGTPGIETLRISPTDVTPTRQSPTKTSCLFPKLALKKGLTYRLQINRAGEVAARGVYVRALPLSLTAPLSLNLAPGDSLSLRTVPNLSFLVRTAGEGSLRCGWEGSPLLEARGSVCSVPPNPGKARFRLEVSGREPVQALLVRPSSSAKPIIPLPVVLTPASLPTLEADAPAFFSLEREGTHSRLFVVREPGLYDVTTEGLLATRCELRTPAIPSLTQDLSGGRGRNCLVAAYLRPGRYLVTVRTQGQSKGRASLRLTRRPVQEAGPLNPGGEVFFRSDAGELIQERLHVVAQGVHRLSTVTTGGAPLQCRLEDDKGWPVLKVPSPCQLDVTLAKGDYRWTQLPATVETQRRSAFERVVHSAVLTGNRRHSIELNTNYTAVLGKDGKDEFLFQLSADAPVRIQLTNGMQARLYRQGDDERAVHLIPPAADGTPPGPANSGEGDGESGSEEETEPAEVDAELADTNSSTPHPQAEGPTDSPEAAEPAGQRLELQAGAYRLVAEHSRGDVAIRYGISVGTPWLVPGVSRELPVPSRVHVRIPQAGIIRLLTRGTADVHCRLLSANGTRLGESGEHGSDWNCALAEPVPAGDHVLVLESDNGLKGTTRVQLEAPPVEELAPPLPKGEWKVAGAVLRAPLPPLEAGMLASLELTSEVAFSCALEAPSGNVVARVLDSHTCAFHVLPRGQTYRVRVWTTGEDAILRMSSQQRRIQPASPGHLGAHAAARIPIPHAGRYHTAPGILCALEETPGPLWPCGPEVSLEKGDFVFVASEGKESPLPLNEEVAHLSRTRTDRWGLSAAPYIQNQGSDTPAIHLLSVVAAAGSPEAPACQLAGGVRARTALACFAAAGVAPEVEARAWVKGTPEDAEVTQRAVGLPSTWAQMAPGVQSLRWKGEAQRVRLPNSPFWVGWTLPHEAWAVQLDEAGKIKDLCPPQPALARCGFLGQGGEVVIVSPHEGHADGELQLLEALPAPRALPVLLEEVSTAIGALRFHVAAADKERRLEIQGASACVLDRDDGVRDTRCDTTLPAGITARLWMRHTTAPLRVLLAPPSARTPLLAGSFPGGAATAAWPAGTRLRLDGTAIERTLSLKSEGVVRFDSEAGVCVLEGAEGILAVEGSGESCSIQRVLAPGQYHVRVRSFGALPLRGGATWTSRPVEALKEGVAQEGWCAPGEVRFFRFSTASSGKVGLGLQAPSDVLDCTVLDANQRVLGDGCQQLLALPQGSFYLTVRAPPDGEPQSFRPVLVGLAGAKTEVPREYLESFFQRIGENQ